MFLVVCHYYCIMCICHEPVFKLKANSYTNIQCEEPFTVKVNDPVTEPAVVHMILLAL